MIELKNIRKSFGKDVIIKDISMQVEKGDVISILGPSGSGKTTLLRCINFLEKPDSGEMVLDNLHVDLKKASKKEILSVRRKTAMVFQQYNLFQNLTALENVMKALIVVQGYTKVKATEKSLALLEKVGLSDKANLYPSQLSGGQQQRISIARALALEPEIILFDEPTSALDPELVGEVLQVIRKIADEGVTMVIVTHEMSFAREISNQIVFMENGFVVENGPPEQLFENPQEERTKQFLAKHIAPWSYQI
ncbi:amino acid ABC transporter ATP-binding protein [Ureibacillus composti]|nr:amino acid ABC transporter ATP-binding protein [Ureibacillus composti]